VVTGERSESFSIPAGTEAADPARESGAPDGPPAAGLPPPDDDGLSLVAPPPLVSDESGDDDERVMTLVEHLNELRTRILVSIAAVAVLAGFTLYHAARLTGAIVRTAPGVEFLALSPMEVFFTELKIGLLSAIILAVPVITWQVWGFIRPGLKRHERRFLRILVPATTVLFAAGAAFAFFVVIPVGVRFLSSFTLASVKPQYSLEAYTSFVLFLVLGLGAIFEAPVVIVAIARLGLVTSGALAERRRHVVLGCFIAAAIMTPTPDVVTQTLVAVPMWLLFESTLVALRVMGL
jgi:sec-independent protein translocase protein TatC